MRNQHWQWLCNNKHVMRGRKFRPDISAFGTPLLQSLETTLGNIAFNSLIKGLIGKIKRKLTFNIPQHYYFIVLTRESNWIFRLDHRFVGDNLMCWSFWFQVHHTLLWSTRKGSWFLTTQWHCITDWPWESKVCDLCQKVLVLILLHQNVHVKISF